MPSPTEGPRGTTASVSASVDGSGDVGGPWLVRPPGAPAVAVGAYAGLPGLP